MSRFLICLALLLSPSVAMAAASRGYVTTAAGRVYYADDRSGGGKNVTNFPFSVFAWIKETTDPGGATDVILAGLSPQDWANSYMYIGYGQFGDRVYFTVVDPAEAKSCTQLSGLVVEDSLDRWVSMGGRMDASNCYVSNYLYDDSEVTTNSAAHTITDLQGIQHTGTNMERGGGHGSIATGQAGLIGGIAWWNVSLPDEWLTEFQQGTPPQFVNTENIAGVYMPWCHTAVSDAHVDYSANGITYDEVSSGTEQEYLVERDDGPPWFWPMGGN